MNLIDNIVEIQISKASLGLASGDFGTLLIIGDSKGKHRVKTYSNLHEVTEDYESSDNEYKAASLAFGQKIKLPKILIGQVMEEDQDKWGQAYRAISSENSNFYAVMITSKSESAQLEIAAIVETEHKIFGISNNESSLLDAQDEEHILHFLRKDNRKRTFVLYGSSAEEGIYLEAAWFGLMLTKQAGSASWVFKELSGIKSDKLTSSDINALDTKNGNYFANFAGRDVTFNGTMANGGYIDTIRGLDWLNNELQIQVGTALVQTDKIIFTNQGIAVIESMIRNSLSKAARFGIIDGKTIKVETPDARTISEADKAKRTLTGVKFEANLAGAIHKLKIQGTISN